jgi:hypothetical protein
MRSVENQAGAWKLRAIDNLPWWTQGLIVATALAVLVGVAHAVPPEWAWIALATAIGIVVFFLLFNPRYRFLRLSSVALRGWLAGQRQVRCSYARQSVEKT